MDETTKTMLEGFAVLIASGLGVAIVQGIKAMFTAAGKALEGLPALYVTFGVSVALAVLTMVINSALFTIPLTWESSGVYVGWVFTLATIIYKNLSQAATVKK